MPYHPDGGDSPKGCQRDMSRAARVGEKRIAKLRREELVDGAAPYAPAPIEAPRAEQREAPWAEPRLTIEPRREVVRRARDHADEVLDLLGFQQAMCAAMPLTKQR